jgi:hypothetical protein
LVAVGRKLAELKHRLYPTNDSKPVASDGCNWFHDFLFCLGLMALITLPCILFGKLDCNIVLYTGERSST